MARGAGAALAALALLVFAGQAAAATPQRTSQKIFRDLADNGRLDGHYSRAQIDRALHTPSLRRYDLEVKPAGQTKPSIPNVSAPVVDTRGTLPFSGLDVALFTGVGGPLLILGASVGRVARVRTRGELRR